MTDLPNTRQGPRIRHYGTLADGAEVILVTLVNSSGIEVDIISYGGIITRLVTPDARGIPKIKRVRTA